jgi:hypothetical protein
MTDIDPDSMYTIREAALLRKCSEATIQKLRKEGRLTCTKDERGRHIIRGADLAAAPIADWHRTIDFRPISERDTTDVVGKADISRLLNVGMSGVIKMFRTRRLVAPVTIADLIRFDTARKAPKPPKPPTNLKLIELTKLGFSARQIAAMMNAAGLKTTGGRAFTKDSVTKLLTRIRNLQEKEELL